MTSAKLLQKDGHAIILGQTGLGKTALVRSLVRRASHQDWSRILIADPGQEYGTVAVTVQSTDELAGYLDQAGESWRVAYQGDDLDDTFAVLCESAYTMSDVLLIAEEADFWCNPGQILPEFAHLLKYGRKRGVIVCGVARRPSEVHRLLTSQSRCVASFGTAEPVDLEYLRRAVSVEFAAVLPDLPPLTCAWWDRRERVIRRLRVDPAAEQIHDAGAGITPPAREGGPRRQGDAAG